MMAICLVRACVVLLLVPALMFAQDDLDGWLRQSDRLFAENRFEEARETAMRVCKVLEAQQPSEANRALRIKSKALLGMTEWRLGRLNTAIPLLQEACNMCYTQTNSVAQDSGPLFMRLAEAYQEAGRYAEAEKNYLLGYSVLSRVLSPDSVEAVRVLTQIAGFYVAMGDANRAEPYAMRGMMSSMNTNNFNRMQLADALLTMGLVNRHLGLYKEAERCVLDGLKALEKERELGRNPAQQYSQALHLLAALKAAQGDLDAAYRVQLDALGRIGRAGNLPPGLKAVNLNNLGWFALGLARYEEAASHISEAIAIHEQQGSSRREEWANAVATMALIAAYRRDPQSLHLARRSGSVYDGLLDNVMRMGTEDQKVAFIRKIEGKTHLTLELHLNFHPGQPDYARLAVETVLRRKDLSADTMRPALIAARRSRDPRVQANLQILNRLHGDLSRMALRTGKPYDADEAKQLWDLRSERDKCLRSFVEEVDDWSTYETQGITVESVCRALPPGSVLVEFVLYRTAKPSMTARMRSEEPWDCAVYLIFPDGRIEGRRLGSMKDIEPHIAALTLSWSRPRGGEENAAERAAAALLHPWLDSVANASMLFIAPDGPLHRVPFGALPDRTGQPLLGRMPVTYLGSGRDLLLLQTRIPARSVAAVLAHPDFDAGTPGAAVSDKWRSNRMQPYMVFSPLPGTGREADMLKQVLTNVRILKGIDVTKSALRALQGPAIVHIATHGFFLDENQAVMPGTRGIKLMKPGPAAAGQVPSVPELALRPDVSFRPPPDFDIYRHPFLRAGLALSGANHFSQEHGDGIITAMEVISLDLEGTSLVVLSACETGAGTTEGGIGVFGMRRAFRQAGARTQVLSLWKVDDEATSALMALFYRHMAKGTGKAEALRQAQMDLVRDNPQWRHPYYWSAFVLSGDWRPF